MSDQLNLLRRLADAGAAFVIVDGYAAVKQASEVVTADGMPMRVLTLEALIRARRALSRPRDRDVLRQLEAPRALREDGA